jgi:hypothetical protein
MTLNSRLDKIEAALGRDDDYPALIVVVEDEDGRWWNGETAIEPATVDPRTRVLVFRQRPDGPQ